MQIVDMNNNPLTRAEVRETCELNGIHPAEVNSLERDMPEDERYMAARCRAFRDPSVILGDYEMSLSTKLKNYWND